MKLKISKHRIFLEHMLLKGTNKRSNQMIFLKKSDIGAYFNAYTDKI